jgi:hypothetical protein
MVSGVGNRLILRDRGDRPRRRAEQNTRKRVSKRVSGRDAVRPHGAHREHDPERHESDQRGDDPEEREADQEDGDGDEPEDQADPEEDAQPDICLSLFMFECLP